MHLHTFSTGEPTPATFVISSKHNQIEVYLVGDGRRDVRKLEDDLSDIHLRGGYVVSMMKSEPAQLESETGD